MLTGIASPLGNDKIDVMPDDIRFHSLARENHIVIVSHYQARPTSGWTP